MCLIVEKLTLSELLTSWQKISALDDLYEGRFFIPDGVDGLNLSLILPIQWMLVVLLTWVLGLGMGFNSVHFDDFVSIPHKRFSCEKSGDVGG
jgi:hypothetical protein